MEVALGVFRLKPTGGLERHALRIADALADRGHRVVIHATNGAELASPGVEILTLPRLGHTNHGGMSGFSSTFAAAAKHFDVRVGFQGLEDLDVLFCADWCYGARRRASVARWLPRYRAMSRLEAACFGPGSRTRIIALAEPQLADYVGVYGTPESRTIVLPPTLDPVHRRDPDPARRQRARAGHGLPDGAVAWLWLGLQPRVKGLDRAVDALARRPEAVLLIGGPEPRSIAGLMNAAGRSGLAGRIRVLGMLADEALADAFAAADLLVHPARLDVTAAVILEAMAHGVPVVTTANCGFAPHVTAADAGVVVPMPFEQPRFDAALASADAAHRAAWSRNAITYCADPWLYSGIERACDLIEAAAEGEDAWRRAVAAAARRDV